MKYEDVHHALRDHDTFSPVTALVGKLTPRLTLIQDDPPRHSLLRRIVNQTFTPRRAEANITLNTLLDRFSSLTRGAAPAVRQTAAVSFCGFHRLPLVLGA